MSDRQNIIQDLSSFFQKLERLANKAVTHNTTGSFTSPSTGNSLKSEFTVKSGVTASVVVALNSAEATYIIFDKSRSEITAEFVTQNWEIFENKVDAYLEE